MILHRMYVCIWILLSSLCNYAFDFYLSYFLTPIILKSMLIAVRPSLNLNSCSSSIVRKFNLSPTIVHLRMGRSKMWCQTLMFPLFVILTHQSITLGNWLSSFCFPLGFSLLFYLRAFIRGNLGRSLLIKFCILLRH